jgi:hypothetical protein
MKDFPVAVGATIFEGERTLPLQHAVLDGPLEDRGSHWRTITDLVLKLKC